MADRKQKFATIVYRAGTKQGPSFHLKDKSIEKVWLVTNPKLYYCLGQGKKQLEEVWLWEADVSNLSDDIAYCNIDCEVIQVELSQWQDSRNTEKTVEEIHTHLKSLDWQMAAIPQCNGGFSLMKLSPMVQTVIVYMRDHYPTTPEELNFHAELKAASHWCFSDDYEQLAMKEVPVNDCRLRIAATETLKTWEKEKEDLESSKANNMYKDGDSSDESVDEQLSDVIEAIRVLNVYLSSKNKAGLSPFTEETIYPPILPESLGKGKTSTTYAYELQKMTVYPTEMKLNPDKSNKNHLGMEPVGRACVSFVTLI